MYQKRLWKKIHTRQDSVLLFTTQLSIFLFIFLKFILDRNNFECHFSDCLHRNPIRFFVLKLAPQIRSVDRFCRFALGQISQIHTLLVKTHLKHKFTNVINSTVHKWIRHHLSGHFAMSFHPFVVMSTCNLETKLQDEIKLRLL